MREKVESSPRARDLDVPLAEPSEADLFARVRSTAGRSPRPSTDDEVVLRTVLPGEQLDAVADADAGPAPVWSDEVPGAEAATVTDFLSAVAALPHWRTLRVRLGETSLALTRDDPPRGAS